MYAVSGVLHPAYFVGDAYGAPNMPSGGSLTSVSSNITYTIGPMEGSNAVQMELPGAQTSGSATATIDIADASYWLVSVLYGAMWLDNLDDPAGATLTVVYTSGDDDVFAFLPTDASDATPTPGSAHAITGMDVYHGNHQNTNNRSLVEQVFATDGTRVIDRLEFDISALVDPNNDANVAIFAVDGVPEPSLVWLGMGGLLVVMARRRR